MKTILIMIALVLPLSTNACEKTIDVKLYQSRLSLDLWAHAKDSMNAVKFKLPVSCKFHKEVKVGDNLLKDGFRAGSFMVRGSVGKWNLKVIGK